MARGQNPNGTAQAGMHPVAKNAMNRNATLRQSVDMWQKVYSNTFTPSSGNNVLNITPRNVGLIKGFLVKVLATVSNSGTGAITPTKFGGSNVLSQVVFNDLNNYVRINTAGWHLHLVESAKRRHPFGAANTTDSTLGYGNNYTPFLMPSSIAAAANGSVEVWYWIPLAYHQRDLRGAIYANVLNATMNLQLTINPTPVVNSSADATLAMYTGAAAAAGSITSTTVVVYQNFLDQMPRDSNGRPAVPEIDISSIYELKNTNLVGLTVGQDFPAQYSNFRDFLSTSFIFDNGGTLNAGTDINYVAIETANFTNILQVEPGVLSLWARDQFGDDPPQGIYYLDHRRKPINTVQYGNMQLIVNPSTVNSGAVLLLGYEDMGIANTIIPAGSLPGG